MKKVLSVVLVLAMMVLSCCALADNNSKTTNDMTAVDEITLIVIETDTAEVAKAEEVIADAEAAESMEAFFGSDAAGLELIELIPYHFTEDATEGFTALFTFPETLSGDVVALMGLVNGEDLTWDKLDASTSNGQLMVNFTTAQIDAAKAADDVYLAVLQ